MYRAKTSMVALLVGTAITLSACGGGSSSPPVLNDPTDTESGNGLDSETPGVSDMPVGTDMPDGTDMPVDPDIPATPADVTSITVGGRSARAIVAVGGPVVGAPGATMREIGDFQINDGSQITYAGRYDSGTGQPSAIWSGPVTAPVLLFSTGSEIPGFPTNVRYGNSDFFRLANDGSVAHLVQLTGPTENKALIVTNGSDNPVIVQTGDSLMGRSAEVEIGNIASASHSSSATAFTTGNRNSGAQTLWYYQDGAATAVAEQFDSMVDSAAEVANSCRVFTERFSSFDGNFQVTDAGDLLFDAYLRNYSSGPCEEGDAVIRFKDGIHTALVKEGDVVPGASASTFTNIGLIQVTKNGTAIISANVETPTGGSRPDVKWSYWAYPPAGEARLIALEGEEAQVGSNTKNLSHSRFDTKFVTVNDSIQVGLRLDFDNPNEVALFGGVAHAGQPHPALAAPGASSLTYAIDREAILPPPFDDEFFSAIGFPRVDTSGNLVFYGEVTSSVLDAVTSSSIWQIDLEGNLTELVTAGDTVKVSGIDNSLESLVQSSRFRQANTGFIRINNAGAMMFRAALMNQSGNGVIVYIEPAAQ